MRYMGWIVLIMLAYAVPSYAASEARCLALDVEDSGSCIWAHSLDATTGAWTQVSAAYWGVSDGSGHVANHEGVTGAILQRGTTQDWTGVTVTDEATMFAALPAAHTNVRVLKTPTSVTGSWYMGGRFPTASRTARIAMRWYQYYSPDYVWDAGYGGDVCRNSSKVAQLSPESGIFQSYPKHLLYGWASPWTYNSGTSMAGYDCCDQGPGNPTAANASVFLGKWVRRELVVTNRGTTGTAFYLYEKNVTDNTAEVEVINSTTAYTSGTDGAGTGVNWVSLVATTLTRTVWGDIWINNFRDIGLGSACPGFLGMAYLAGAAWGTDSGQRIGAATEIEGAGGADTTPPAAPTGVTIARQGRSR